MRACLVFGFSGGDGDGDGCSQQADELGRDKLQTQSQNGYANNRETKATPDFH